MEVFLGYLVYTIRIMKSKEPFKGIWNLKYNKNLAKCEEFTQLTIIMY